MAASRRILNAGLAAGLVSSFAVSVPTLAGYTLDSSFGVNGIAATDFGPNNADTPEGLVLQPDGKIVSAGRSDGGASERYIALTRHFADGTVDPSFGTAGKVQVSFTFRDQAKEVIVQDDGKLVVVGQQAATNAGSAINPSIYRFNSDGTPDLTFGTGGQRAIRYPNDSGGEFFGVNALPDGRLLAAGVSAENANGGVFGFGAVRFEADGDLDQSFDGDGILRIDYPILFARSSSAFTDDGKLHWATTTVAGGAVWFVMARVDAAGTLDASFGTGGFASPVSRPCQTTLSASSFSTMETSSLL